MVNKFWKKFVNRTLIEFMYVRITKIKNKKFSKDDLKAYLLLIELAAKRTLAENGGAQPS